MAVARLTLVTWGWSPSLPVTRILLQGAHGGERGGNPRAGLGTQGPKPGTSPRPPQNHPSAGLPALLSACRLVLVPRLPGASRTERSSGRRRPCPGTCLPTALQPGAYKGRLPPPPLPPPRPCPFPTSLLLSALPALGPFLTPPPAPPHSTYPPSKGTKLNLANGSLRFSA